MSSKSAATSQASIFTRYLCGQDATEAIASRYSQALDATTAFFSHNDQQLLDFIEKHPWSVGSIDGALALVRPNSEVRRRIFLLLALLESSTDYTSYFLPQDRSAWYLLAIFGDGLRAVYRVFIGSVIVAFTGKAS